MGKLVLIIFHCFVKFSLKTMYYFQPLGAYTVSKVALLGLCKAAAETLALENIRVNCIAPGVFRTLFSSVASINFPNILLLLFTIIV